MRVTFMVLSFSGSMRALSMGDDDNDALAAIIKIKLLIYNLKLYKSRD